MSFRDPHVASEAKSTEMFNQIYTHASTSPCIHINTHTNTFYRLCIRCMIQ